MAWNPEVILGGSGTLGLLVVRWPSARRIVAPGCLLALLLAGASGAATSQDVFARGTLAVSVVWGCLLTLAAWPARGGLCDAHGSRRAMSSPLLLVLLSGLCFTARANDIVTLFLGLQLVATGVNVLRKIQSTRPAADSADEFAHLSADSLLTALLLLGMVLLTAVTGSTRLDTIHEALQASYVSRDATRSAIAGGGSRVLMLSVVFIGAALAGHAACAPFHWQTIRTAAHAAPTWTAPLWLLPRAAALLAWLKFWPTSLTAVEDTARLLAGVLSAITFSVPLLAARLERNLARQWTLLAMAQGGWLLLAVATWSFGDPTPSTSGAWPIVEWNLPSAAQAAWLWLLLDGVAVIGLFGVLASLRRRERSVEFLDDLRGLIRFEPLAAICACLCLWSLAGAPLLAGFWPRLFLAMSACAVRGEWGPPQMLVPHVGLLVLTVLAALSTVWSAAIVLRSVWTMFFGLPLGQSRSSGALSSLFVAVLASLILAGCGLLPGPLLSWMCEPG